MFKFTWLCVCVSGAALLDERALAAPSQPILHAPESVANALAEEGDLKALVNQAPERVRAAITATGVRDDAALLDSDAERRIGELLIGVAAKLKIRAHVRTAGASSLARATAELAPAVKTNGGGQIFILIFTNRPEMHAILVSPEARAASGDSEVLRPAINRATRELRIAGTPGGGVEKCVSVFFEALLTGVAAPTLQLLPESGATAPTPGGFDLDRNARNISVTDPARPGRDRAESAAAEAEAEPGPPIVLLTWLGVVALMLGLLALLFITGKKRIERGALRSPKRGTAPEGVSTAPAALAAPRPARERLERLVAAAQLSLKQTEDAPVAGVDHARRMLRHYLGELAREIGVLPGNSERHDTRPL